MGEMMKRAIMLLLVAGLVWGSGCLTGCAGPAPGDSPLATATGSLPDASQELPLLASWSGDFPVAQLDLLPVGQRQSSVGYLGDMDAFAAVWPVLQPGQDLPEVDFVSQLVVFSRNVNFYNRTAIFKVTLKEGTAEVMAMETMSAMPIEDTVVMALAVIPRAGVRFITSGDERIAVP